MFELTEDQQLVQRTMREFVAREVMPVASRLEHADEYPHALVGRLKELGVFGLNVPQEYGGNLADYTTLALVLEELSRGWVGLTAAFSTRIVSS